MTSDVARVRVPATSANLGPGFDTLGLALGLHDEIEARVTEGGLRIEVEGQGADDVPRDDSHLVVRAMHRAFDVLGEQPPGLALHCTNHIPHSRGLGSSAAAIVAGVLLAGALAGRPDLDALAVAADLEGHPDNVAPCLRGGLTIAWTAPDGARALRRDLDPSVRPIVLVPPFTASTELARGLLPPTVPHADAAFNAARCALLVAALTGDPDVLLQATEDRLHQAYRAPAMAASAELVGDLRARGHAAVISGAGPTVLVLSSRAGESAAVRDRTPAGWRCLALDVDRDGAQLTN